MSGLLGDKAVEARLGLYEGRERVEGRGCCWDVDRVMER